MSKQDELKQETAQTTQKPAGESDSKPEHKRGARRPMATLQRAIGLMIRYYPAHTVIILICIITQAVVATLPSMFLQQAIAVVGQYWKQGDWSAAAAPLMQIAFTLLGCYVLALIAIVIETQLAAVVTQGTLMRVRNDMFSHMEDLPIRYFDTRKHGDIMSTYTNDVDTLRQLIGVALPNLLISGIAMISVLALMLWYSVPLSLVVLVVIALMFWVIRLLGGRSARFFLDQQHELAHAEGFVEEAMSGQKVIKVFTHEEATKASFAEVNARLFEASNKANIYGNTLAPILMNMGNIAYVLVALMGIVMLETHMANPSISGMLISIDIVIPFLNMTKRFAGQIGQVSNQINFVVMGLAGAERIFELLDEPTETDEGYVTLVNVVRDSDGSLHECHENSGKWAWKHPHKNSGKVDLIPLQGEVVFVDVDFGYKPDHEVLHDISLYALPGQKVAFVGATGAGKTTITNLVNRFYDISDGKIRYDGINIDKIRKADLRRSLGMVLQDTNLFTGTVMDNIRYGKLSASDEECIRAAKIAGADSFIRRLPQSYETMLTDNAARLSQGQRQLLSIARAAVADPPVMILDEATSSIDTRTEQIVQRGMDALMEGRTTFVIAHRLSTVRNSDVIIVLDHGHIIERGTHDDLIAAKGTYYQLYTGAFELE